MTKETHSVNRTSPQGEKFIGTCSKCGKPGLTLGQAMTETCPNVRRISDDDDLLEVLSEPPR